MLCRSKATLIKCASDLDSMFQQVEQEAKRELTSPTVDLDVQVGLIPEAVTETMEILNFDRRCSEAQLGEPIYSKPCLLLGASFVLKVWMTHVCVCACILSSVCFCFHLLDACLCFVMVCQVSLSGGMSAGSDASTSRSVDSQSQSLSLAAFVEMTKGPALGIPVHFVLVMKGVRPFTCPCFVVIVSLLLIG